MSDSTHQLVIDTNVFISGLISGSGPSAEILSAIRKGLAIHLVSDPIVDEYLRVLNYPRIRKFKAMTDTFVANIAAYLVHKAERVELETAIRVSPDPDDDMFLATAVDGQATMLITGDKNDLLSLTEIEGIPIVSAKEGALRLKA